VKRLWQRCAERIDDLSLRERVLIFFAATVLVLAPLYVLLIEGQLRLQKQLSASVAQRQTEMKILEGQLRALATGRERDPDRPAREKLAAVRSQLADVDREIAMEERKFTAPEQMKKVIEEMLARNASVRLVAMKSIPTTSIAETRAAPSKPAGKPATPTPGERLIYRHGLEVTVRGTYLDLLRYLLDLEHLPTQLYWGSLALDATSYPQHVLKIVVYTLSVDPAWLNV
jgi:MSHA biogenesis protein MshJ